MSPFNSNRRNTRRPRGKRTHRFESMEKRELMAADFGSIVASGDFNGDGFADFAIGNPDANSGQGEVNVVYGGQTDRESWTQNSPRIEGEAEAGDHFGAALAAGDFNGDGYADLAIGVPDEDVGSVKDAGAVNILYGSRKGLQADGNTLWTQDSKRVAGAAERGDHFGSALAAGDFDGNGRDDLAIGVPDEDVGSAVDAGAVNVLYGSKNGLRADDNQLWDQDSSGVEGKAEAGDRFGASLAAGDFDGNGRDDLAVGAPQEDVGKAKDAGAVNVLYGSKTVLTSAGNQVWDQDSTGIGGTAEAGDLFGAVLATGDFNGDGKSDLAIGAPNEDVGSAKDAGAVNVIYGRKGGLHSDGDQVWDQDNPGIQGTAEAGDHFGASLTTGDFDGDDRADLVIGVPNEDVGKARDAGALNVIFGKSSGLHTGNDQLIDQGSRGVSGAPEAADLFAFSLAAGDFDNDGFDDLLIGILAEDQQFVVDRGAVQLLHGSRPGVDTTRGQLWNRNHFTGFVDVNVGVKGDDLRFVLEAAKLEKVMEKLLNSNFSGKLEEMSSDKKYLEISNFRVDFGNGKITVKLDYSAGVRSKLGSLFGKSYYSRWVTDSGTVTVDLSVGYSNGSVTVLTRSGAVRWSSNNWIVNTFKGVVDNELRQSVADNVNHAIANALGTSVASGASNGQSVNVKQFVKDHLPEEFKPYERYVDQIQFRVGVTKEGFVITLPGMVKKLRGA